MRGLVRTMRAGKDAMAILDESGVVVAFISLRRVRSWSTAAICVDAAPEYELLNLRLDDVEPDWRNDDDEE